MNKENDQLLSDINKLKDRVRLDINDIISSQFRLEMEDFLDWFSNCLNVFEKIQLQNHILKNFIFSCEKKLDEKSKIDGKVYIIFNGSDEDRIKVAFKLAELKILRLDENERLVPKYLINSLSEDEKFNKIVSSLENIEKNYEDKNSSGLNVNVTTLIESILDLDDDLKVLRNISEKISKLSNKETRAKFGIKDDIVCALNNARIIRNIKDVHKSTLPIEYNTPFIVSMSFASLTILFLEITLATGELIK